MKYELRKLDENTINELIELSRLWVKEDCSYGIVVNDAIDIKEPLIVALDEDVIVGYIFGHYYITENKNSYIEVGNKCFSVDELYVSPKYRSKGIGKALFRYLENEVRGKCSYITLSTSTKNYQAILKLYVEELGMNFHSAFLIKDVIDNIKIEESAMAVVLCDNKILATNELIYGKERVSLPKGHKEENEIVLDTAIRECFEETNIVVSKDNLVKELTPFSYEFSTPSDELIRKTIYPFLFEINDFGDPLSKEERIVWVKWLEKEEFLNLCTHDNVKEIVRNLGV